MTNPDIGYYYKETHDTKEEKSMTEKELMLSEHLYIAKDIELAKDNKKARKLTRLINASTEEDTDERLTLFRELFGSVGDHFWWSHRFTRIMAAIPTLEKTFMQIMTASLLMWPRSISGTMYSSVQESAFTQPVIRLIQSSAISSWNTEKRFLSETMSGSAATR